MPKFEVEIVVTEIKTVRITRTYKVPVKAKDEDAACDKMSEKVDELDITEPADLPASWVESDCDEETDTEWEFDVSSAEEMDDE